MGVAFFKEHVGFIEEKNCIPSYDKLGNPFQIGLDLQSC